jgi:uncharacterized repeat protein (TIGR01451 family)
LVSGTIGLNAQCANDNILFSSINIPTCPGTGSVACLYGGEYTTLNVIAGNRYVISTCGDTDFDTQLTLYSAAGTLLAFNDDACGLQSSITYDALITQTIRILVDQMPCTANSVCMTVNVSCTAIPAPMNDTICGAIPLVLNSVPYRQTFSAFSATSSPITTPLPSCSFFNQPDLWHTVNMPGNGNLTLNFQSGNTAGVAVYTTSGDCDGTLTQISCTTGSNFATTITPAMAAAGSRLYIRVWFTSVPNSLYAMSAVGTPPPVNDEPCNAIFLNPLSSCVFQQYTNVGATATNINDPGCANYAGGDVWFSTTMPATGDLVVNMNTGVLTDMGMALYYSSNTFCNSLGLIACDDDSSPNGNMPMITVPAGSVPAGARIYIRVWEYANNAFGTFNICTQGSTVLNDEPCYGSSISWDNTCNYTYFSNVGATATTTYTSLPAPSCGSYLGGDVWTTITMPPVGDLVITSIAGTVTDLDMALYTATTSCFPAAVFTLIACDDFSGPGVMPQITVPHGTVTPGATIYIRMFEYGNNTFGNWGICATAISCDGNNPGSDACATATQICEPTEEYCTRTGAPYTANSIGTTAPCGSIDANQYYVFVAGETTVTFELTVANCVSGNGIQLSLFTTNACTDGTYAYASGSAATSCFNQILPGTSTRTFNNLTVGQRYYLMIDPFAGDPCAVTMRNFTGIIGSPRISPNPIRVCSGEEVTLSVTGGLGPYVWSNGHTGSSITVATTSSSFSYFVTANGGIGGVCPNTTTATVYANINSVVLSANEPCLGQALILNANVPGYTYQWTGPGGWTDNVRSPTRAGFNLSMVGSYFCTSTDAYGCTTAHRIYVSAPTNNQIVGPAGRLCPGNPVRLSVVQNGGATFAWSGPNGNTSSTNFINVTATVANAGIYTVTITDASSGCVATANYNLQINTNPSQAEICGNGIDDDCDGLIDCLDDACRGQCPDQFECDNTMYTVESAVLRSLETNPVQFTNLTELDNIGYSVSSYNGLGLNPIDGYLYCFRTNSNNTSDLIRIDNNLNETIVYHGMPNFAVSACFGPNGLLYYLNGANLMSFNLATNAVTLVCTNPQFSNIADMAISPVDGFLYIWINFRLYRMNLNTCATVATSAPQAVNFSGSPTTMFINGNNEMYMTMQGTLWRVNLSNGFPTNLGTGLSAGSGTDGASCPFRVEIEKVVSPLVVNPGQIATYTFTLTNNTNAVRNNVSFSDVLSNGFTWHSDPQSVSAGLVFAASPSIIGGTNANLMISSLPRGVSSFQLYVITPSTYPQTAPNPYLNQATLGGLPAFLGTIVSDYPPSAAVGDATPLFVCNSTVTLTPDPLELCPDGTSAGITISTSTPTGIIVSSYNWTTPYGTANGSTPPAVTQAGTYSVTITDANGCTATDAVTTTAPSVPAITGGPGFCSGNTLALSASGGVSYQWSGPGGITGSAAGLIRFGFNPSMVGTYTVTVTSAGGCTQTAAVNVVDVSFTAAINSSATSQICPGTTVTLNASPLTPTGVCGTGSYNCTTTATPTAAVAASGTNVFGPFTTSAESRFQFIYRASELIANGYSAGVIKTIAFNNTGAGGNVYQNLNISLGCTSIASFPTIGASFQTGLTTYLSTASYTIVAGFNTFSLGQGFYWNGVSNIVIEFCYDNPASAGPNVGLENAVGGFVATAGANNTGSVSGGCALTPAFTSGGRPRLYVAMCGFGYTWSTGATTASITVNPTVSTTYSVTVTNGSCSQVANVNLDVSTLDVSLSGPTSYCEGSSPITINASTTGMSAIPCATVLGTCTPSGVNVPSGTAILGGYSLPFGANVNDMKSQMLYLASELTAQGLTAGYITRIALNVTSKSSSQPFTNFTIKMACTPTTSFTTGQAFITSLTQVYSANYSTVLGLNTIDLQQNFYWDGTSNLVIEFCHGSTANNGNDFVSYNSLGYNATHFASTTNAALDACTFTNSTGQAILRAHLLFQLCSVNTWSNGATGSSISVTPTSTTTYTVTATDGICTVTDNHTVTFNPAPPVSLSYNNPVCEGSGLQLNASGASTYSWTGPAAFSSSLASPSRNNASLAFAGTYNVTATGANACTASASLPVVINTLPIVTAANTSPACRGNSVQFQAGGALTYTWTGPGAYSNTGPYPDLDNVTSAQAGTYSVTGVDVNGCPATATTTVTVNTCPEICNNGIDDDDDGISDDNDPDCPCNN